MTKPQVLLLKEVKNIDNRDIPRHLPILSIKKKTLIAQTQAKCFQSSYHIKQLDPILLVNHDQQIPDAKADL